MEQKAMTRKDCIDTIDQIQSGHPRRARLLETLLLRLTLWRQRARERRQLSSLDGYLLKDIGLSAADVWQETHKPFWRS
jgi:uncharacterized protein YjiS (DUF1127 family)